MDKAWGVGIAGTAESAWILQDDDRHHLAGPNPRYPENAPLMQPLLLL